MNDLNNLKDFSPKATKIKNSNMKREYMKPTVHVVVLQQQCQILAGSTQGLNDELQSEEVGEGFAPFFNGLEL